jgi:RNA polymerase sigma factor (sigma-70 family)
MKERMIEMEKELLIQLVTDAQSGDAAAAEKLFAAFYNDVYYFALKTVKDSDLACDITQETFLEIIRTIGNLKEPAAFVTWMKQITYHQCTRYFKKRKEVQVEENEDGSTIFDTMADERADSIPAEVYAQEEFRRTILGMINELTEEQRSAVMLYYFDELSVGQIAEIQSVSEGTVKSRLNYARKALRKSVENYEKKHNIKLRAIPFFPLFKVFISIMAPLSPSGTYMAAG